MYYMLPCWSFLSFVCPFDYIGSTDYRHLIRSPLTSISENTNMFNTPRLKKELSQLLGKPPIGIKVNVKEGSASVLEAELHGPKDTPYEAGTFKLQIELPPKYPFEPPRVTFVTPIYHPNIDSSGRICLDILKMPPTGAWKPLITIEGVIVAICNLMSCPNPNDPLVPDIAKEFKNDKETYESKAKSLTKIHALPSIKN